MVKPILKKLSHSEKNSLDLDRPWEEQQGPGLVGHEPGGASRSVRDVSFSFGDGSFAAAKPRFQHGRSPSGTSHVSIATTASGGGATSRPIGFVHPFQQTPRTQTPPLTYANSVVSLDNAFTFNNGSSSNVNISTSNGSGSGNGNGNIVHTANSSRDYSPTITENDDDDDDSLPGSLPNHLHHHSHGSSFSPSSLRKPSLVNQRAASFSDINAAPNLRLNTARSIPSNSALRRAHGGSSLSSSVSHSDLHLNAAAGTSNSLFDSPILSTSSFSTPFNTGAGNGANAALTAPPTTSSGTPLSLSPLRSSLEGVGFPRLRSRSEVDAGARAEQIREARRKFEERERAKAEKHDREMLRKRERRDNREAKELERQAAAQLRKNSTSASDTIRPSLSLSNQATSALGGISGSTSTAGSRGYAESGKQGRRPADLTEKALDFKSSNYDNMAGGTTPSFGPTVEDVAFKNARRNNTTKRKTQGYWNGFMLWLRTRLFRLGKK